jgi:uncharacterized protein with GYD domain
MATFLMIAKHTPQNCPLFNAQTRKVYANWFAKFQDILQKYGVKVVAGCSVVSEHLTICVFEAPNLEALQRAGMEPEIFAVNMVDTIEIKPAISIEEAFKTFQQHSQEAPIPA